MKIEVAPSRVERGIDEGLMVALRLGDESVVDSVIALGPGQNPPKARTDMVELAVVPARIMIAPGFAEITKLPAVIITVVEWLSAPLVAVTVKW